MDTVDPVGAVDTLDTVGAVDTLDTKGHMYCSCIVHLNVQITQNHHAESSFIVSTQWILSGACRRNRYVHVLISNQTLVYLIFTGGRIMLTTLRVVTTYKSTGGR